MPLIVYLISISCTVSITLNCSWRDVSLKNQLTSFIKVMLKLLLLVHDVCVSSDVHSVVLLNPAIVQLVVELVRCRVMRVSTWVFVIAVIIIEYGGLANRHADHRAAVLVGASRAPVAVAALRTEQNRGDVVDLVGGLGAGALLRDTPTLAPSVTGVQDKREEED